MERQTKDPTQLALMEADVSEDPEAARRIAEAWDQMSVTETDEFMKNAGFKTDERRMYSALQESGLDVQHLNNSITDSEYSAMEDAPSEKPNSTSVLPVTMYRTLAPSRPRPTTHMPMTEPPEKAMESALFMPL